MKTRNIGRLLATALTTMLLVAVTTVTAMAADTVTYQKATLNDDGTVTFTTGTATTVTYITENSTSLKAGWYVVGSDVTISSRIAVSGAVHLILADEATLTASAGITVEGDNSLTIYAQSTGDDMGKLVATGTSVSGSVGSDAGIGGTVGTTAGFITINGGDITATGGASSSGSSGTGAGIGGGGAYYSTPGSGGTITINGGTIEATGGSASGDSSGTGAGIGAGGRSANNGDPGSGGTIIINGGDITAAGGYAYSSNSGTGAGIGGGGARYGTAGSGGAVTIHGGTVTATGGTSNNIWVWHSSDSSGTGAGIGGGGCGPEGSAGAGGTVAITGGIVIATGGTATYSSCGTGAGIGGGGARGEQSTSGGAGGTVTIDSGTVTATGGSVSNSSSATGAGIGGGGCGNRSGGAGGTITINGGDITATGGTASNSDANSGAGIGGGASYSDNAGAGGAVTINGGTVTASGGSGSSPGIGSGSSENTTLGTVTLGATMGYVTSTEPSEVVLTLIKSTELESDNFPTDQYAWVQPYVPTYQSPVYVTTDTPNSGVASWETLNVPTEYTAIVNSDSNETWTDEWYVVTSEATVTGAITISGDVSLVLYSTMPLTASGGITVPSGSSLTIYSSLGTLAVTGISGEGIITINGGTITATDGIGGGDIIINAGTITATGGIYGDDIIINSGDIIATGGTDDDITINGGTVTATGGTDGINGNNITINAGTITANGAENGNGIYAATTLIIYGDTVEATGYGSGAGVDGKAITIHAGTITATGGSSGDGITGTTLIIHGDTVKATGYGSGAGIDVDAITINGGTITATGGSSGDGITGTTLTIYGDIVEATGYGSGAGIGVDDITINGGTTTATGGESGNGISGRTLTIQGDAVTAIGGAEKAAISSPSVTIPDTMGYGTRNDDTSMISNFVQGTGTAVTIPSTYTRVDVVDYVPSVIYPTYVTNEEASSGIESWDEKVLTAFIPLTDETTWTDGWYVVTEDTTIADRITVSGDVHLLLMDSFTLTASTGITVEEGNSLTIYVQSANESTMGALISTASGKNAGIGGLEGNSAGAITINGGIITAESGTMTSGSGVTGAGIGGGSAGDGGTITINGGYVTATGGKTTGNPSATGAGIGGGGGCHTSAGSGGTITINGGTVIANGGTTTNTSCGTGAGIGGGGSAGYSWVTFSSGAGGVITINGGTVTATGGTASSNPSGAGAGIGGGGSYNGTAGTSGTVTIADDMGYGTDTTSAEEITTYTISTGEEMTDFSTDRYAKVLPVDLGWSIITQPVGGAYTYNDTISSLSVAVTGDTSDIAYQWYSCDSDGSTATSIDNATNDTYLSTVSDLGTYYYYCAVSVISGDITVTVYSGIATVTITQASHDDATATGSAMYGNSGSVSLSAWTGLGGYSFTIDEVTSGSDYLVADSCDIEDDTLVFTFENVADNVGETATIDITVSSTNYQDFTITVTLTVNSKITPVISAENISKTYNTETITIDDITVSVEDDVAGSWTFEDGATMTNVTDTGTYSVVFTPDDTDTYVETSTTINVTIEAYEITFAVDDASAYKNASDPEYTYTQSGDLFDGDSWTIAPVVDSSAVDMTTNGTYTLTISADAGDNYTISIETGTLTITTKSNYTPSTSTTTTTTTDTDTADTDTTTTDINPFDDVDPDAYYYDAVLWAVENGITSGVTDTTFAPNATANRGQTVTFLWRAAGQQLVTADDVADGFTDVEDDSYYYDAMVWAVKNGITAGTTDTTFSPYATATRGQIVTFLWRLAGCPVVSGEAMSDVTEGSYYCDAVLWAVSEGITTGYADGTFGADALCNRGQIVTFLYRYLG